MKFWLNNHSNQINNQYTSIVITNLELLFNSINASFISELLLRIKILTKSIWFVDDFIDIISFLFGDRYLVSNLIQIFRIWKKYNFSLGIELLCIEISLSLSFFLVIEGRNGCRGSVGKSSDTHGRGFNPQSRHGGVGQILMQTIASPHRGTMGIGNRRWWQL